MIFIVHEFIYKIDGKFNLEMFQYAVKDYFKRKHEHEEKIKQKQKEEEEDAKPSKPRWFMSILRLEFGLQLFIIILLFILFWYINKGSLLSENIFWK